MDENEKMLYIMLIANILSDGHLTIMKFTTNWRGSFSTPSSREEIQFMYVANSKEELLTEMLIGGFIEIKAKVNRK